jgi:hypothetical protein
LLLFSGVKLSKWLEIFTKFFISTISSVSINKVLLQNSFLLISNVFYFEPNILKTAIWLGQIPVTAAKTIPAAGHIIASEYLKSP